MEIIIILIVILVVFYFCYLNSKNNKLTKTEAFDATYYANSSGIYMYSDINYGGTHFHCRIGYTDYAALNRDGFNDKANSIKIPDGRRAVFYEHANREGKQLSLSTGSYPNLADMGWNNMISCVDVFNV
jgi:hypothetical protein